MVSPIASRSMPAPQVLAQRGTLAESGPGQSAHSVGHQAKAAIAEAAGGNFQPNIQGKIASMIAHHLDVSAVLTPSVPATPADEMPEEPAAVNDPVTGPVPDSAVADTVEASPASALLATDAVETPDTQT
jgi:hypothetical protein